MARTVGMEALEQKIEKAQERVIRTKAAYDEAVNDLQKLLDKKTALEEQEIIKAVTNSKKSYAEIIRYLTEAETED
ncbi:MAG: hypothetical protein LUF35_14110 [Lachnospiraceae bacterium]|nr:hypothetical protein [Lachnospiraceae bacterium]